MHYDFHVPNDSIHVIPYFPEFEDVADIQLSSDHFSILFGTLSRHSAQWREIGIHLGFHPGELYNIQARPLLMSSAPKSWLEAMLSEWLQWAPGDGRGSKKHATLRSLRKALVKSGLREAALTLLQLISTTAQPMQPQP